VRKSYILVGLVVLLAGILYGQDDTAHSSKMTNAQAEQYYSAYNDTYFGGVLPAAEVRFVHNLSSDGSEDMGLTEGPPFIIYLSDKYQDNMRITLMTELHEECHVAVSVSGKSELDAHGPLFQHCMTRLAEEGAFRDLW
jgi:hypothetical protein